MMKTSIKTYLVALLLCHLYPSSLTYRTRCLTKRTPNGKLHFQVHPQPGHSCEVNWSDNNGHVLADGNEFNRTLVSAMSLSDLILKQCLTPLKVIIDCGSVDFKATCSANCSESESLPTPLSNSTLPNRANNGSSGGDTGSQRCGVLPMPACIPLVFGCLVFLLLPVCLYVVWKTDLLNHIRGYLAVWRNNRNGGNGDQV